MSLTFEVHLSVFTPWGPLFVRLHTWNWVSGMARRTNQVPRKDWAGWQMQVSWWFEAGASSWMGKGDRMSSAVGDCWKAFEWRDINSIIIALEIQWLSVVGTYCGGRSIMTSCTLNWRNSCTGLQNWRPKKKKKLETSSWGNVTMSHSVLPFPGIHP